MSPSSRSVAVTAAPTLVPAALFSATSRVALAPSVKDRSWLAGPGSWAGASSTSVRLTVTAMLAVTPLPRGLR